MAEKVDVVVENASVTGAGELFEKKELPLLSVFRPGRCRARPARAGTGWERSCRGSASCRAPGRWRATWAEASRCSSVNGSSVYGRPRDAGASRGRITPTHERTNQRTVLTSPRSNEPTHRRPDTAAASMLMSVGARPAMSASAGFGSAAKGRGRATSMAALRTREGLAQ